MVIPFPVYSQLRANPRWISVSEEPLSEMNQQNCFVDRVRLHLYEDMQRLGITLCYPGSREGNEDGLCVRLFNLS